MDEAIGPQRAFESRDPVYYPSLQVAEGAPSPQDIRSSWIPDPAFVMSSLGLATLGVIMVFSASAPLHAAEGITPFYWVLRQGGYVVLGLALAAGCGCVPLTSWRRLATLALVASMVVLVLILIPGIGHAVGGAYRWLPLGPVRIQGSEFFKIALVLYLAKVLTCKDGNELRGGRGGEEVVPILAVSGGGAGLLLVEPDFGGATMVMGTGLVMGFLGGIRLRHLLATLGVTLAIGIWAIWDSAYRYERIAAFLEPWAHPQGIGFQLRQSLLAFGRGETIGVGLGEGVQKLFYLPEPHTDFIFAVIGEELGLMGTLGVCALYGLLIWRGFCIAERAPNPYGRLVAQGLVFIIGFQALAHMAVNVGLLPTKGLTLPLVSYGGSSLVSTCAALGILLAVDRAGQKRRGTADRRQRRGS